MWCSMKDHGGTGARNQGEPAMSIEEAIEDSTDTVIGNTRSRDTNTAKGSEVIGIEDILIQRQSPQTAWTDDTPP